MTNNANRPAAVALAVAFTLTLWASTLSPVTSANAATLSPAATAPVLVAAAPSIVLM